MKKILFFLLLSLVLSSLYACAADQAEPTGDPVANTPVECSDGTELSLEQINEFLNTSADLGPGSIANTVAIVPIDHIDGPRNESSFYAFVHYKYKARDYIKYQITYLSCTCRAASVNYWQTAYVELSLPESKVADEVTVRYLSFDKDPNGEYNGGFWGDSNPTPAGVSYSVFKTEYIPYFIDKDYASALLAEEINADFLVILTGVEKVAVNFGKPDQRFLDTMTLAQARVYMDEGQFPVGSMGPKVDAAMQFVDRGRGSAIITSLDKLSEAVNRKTGTLIVKE